MKMFLFLISMSMTLMVAIITGCEGNNRLNSTQFVGVWIAVGDGKLELFQDGRFAATNLPLSIVIGPHASTLFGGGSGTWNLVKGRNGPDIQLAFDRLAEHTNGYAVSVHISGRKPDNLRLFFWKGEAGEDRFEFVPEDTK